MGLFHHLTGFDHPVHVLVQIPFQHSLQLFVGVIGGQVAVVRTQFCAGQKAFSAGEGQLQGLVQIEHGGVAPSQVVPLGGQLHAAHHGVVPGVLFVDSQFLQSRYHRLVVEELGHPAALCHHPDGRLQKLVSGPRVEPDGEIGLGQTQMLLGFQKQEG